MSTTYLSTASLHNLWFPPTIPSVALQEPPSVEEPWVPELTFGRRLLLLRTSLGLTQQEIARKCGIHPATWNTWEHGSSPREQGEVAKKIADATGVAKEWLLWGQLVLLTPIIFDTPPMQLEFDFSIGTPEEDPRYLKAVGL